MCKYTYNIYIIAKKKDIDISFISLIYMIISLIILSIILEGIKKMKLIFK